MMKSAAAALALLLTTSLAPAQAPRVAVLRVSDVYRQLEATTRANEMLKAKREEINKDGRLAKSNAMHAELELRRRQLQSSTNKIDPEARLKLEREFAIMSREAIALRADFESFQAARTRAINQEMVDGMKQRLQLIRDTAGKIATESGYDLILDSSGSSNTGVPPLLYAKSADDLTDRVVAALAAPATPPDPTPTNTNTPASNKR
jgi:Skp family chaperone for outer membrane proteins